MAISKTEDIETKLTAAFNLPFSNKRQPHLRGFLRDTFKLLDDGEGVSPTLITSYIFSQYHLPNDMEEVRDKVTAHLLRGVQNNIFKYVGEGRFIVNFPNSVVCGVCGGNKKRRSTRRSSKKGDVRAGTWRKKCANSNRRSSGPKKTPLQTRNVILSDQLISSYNSRHSSNGESIECNVSFR